MDWIQRYERLSLESVKINADIPPYARGVWRLGNSPCMDSTKDSEGESSFIEEVITIDFSAPGQDFKRECGEHPVRW